MGSDFFRVSQNRFPPEHYQNIQTTKKILKPRKKIKYRYRLS